MNWTKRISWSVALPALALLMTLSTVGTMAEDGEEQKVKTIKMYADNWSWTPNTIRVEQGTLVKVAVDNVDATHRFDLKAYKLKVVLPQDKTTEFEFVASKVGEFRWKCGRTCGNGCAKMRGTLIVTAPEPDPGED